MAIRAELLDELLKVYKNPEDILGKNCILNELKQAIMERALAGELTHHLGYEKYSFQGRNSGNSRNGKSSKRVKTESGEVEVEVPRNRMGSFEPQIIKKGRPGSKDSAKRLFPCAAGG
ncbi:MAG: transposase [Nitrospinota bacterium]|nr:transposase [Nitrospinota bacterium]